MPTTRRQRYPTDLTYAEWEHLSPLLTDATTGAGRPGRPRKHPMREIFDAGSCVVRGGCPWRMLPYDFPPWGTVYYWFGRWRLEGLWQRILVNLRRATRQKEGSNPAASDAIVDSQSVRVFEESGIKGHDAGKNLPGRKRHLLVDASGLLRAVRVTPAGTLRTAGVHGSPTRAWYHCDYADEKLEAWCEERTGWQLQVVPCNIGSSAFEVLPRRC